MEYVLCDTSFVSLRLSASKHPERVAHWPAAIVARLDRAILAISVMTRAEIRAGALHAKWDARRWARTERILGSYLMVGLDADVLERFALLWAARRSSGWEMPDFDLWIAATALSRGWPLASCDRDFRHIFGLEHIYLPATPSSRSA